jgi:hypothetical protein
MWECASPDSPTFVALHSVRETFQPDRTGSTDFLRCFDGYGAGFWVGIILGPKDFGDFFTTNTTGTIYSLGEFTVG